MEACESGGAEDLVCPVLWERLGVCSNALSNPRYAPPHAGFLDWDSKGKGRSTTAESFKERLLKSSRPEWLRVAAWILREDQVDKIWQFLTLREVADAFSQLRERFGPRRSVWGHPLCGARELGRL